MTRAQRLWLISGLGALLIGAAFGYFALRPLPRDNEAANPDVGYLIVDSTASVAEGSTGARMGSNSASRAMRETSIGEARRKIPRPRISR